LEQDAQLPNAGASMTSIENKLRVALLANANIREEAERLLEAYLTPQSERAAVMNELIRLFDGPQQREAQTRAAEALSD
jgi:hypothetical protein